MPRLNSEITKTNDPVHTLVNPADLISAMLGVAAKHPGCRVCGCTQDNCARCIGRTGLPCSWAAHELCTACAPLSHTIEGYAERMELAKIFVENLSVFDLFSLAATASVADFGPDAPENEVVCTLLGWFAARRVLVAKKGLGMTIAVDDAVGLAITVMAYPNVAATRDELLRLSDIPNLFATAALSPKLAPFVYLTEPASADRPQTPQQPQPKETV